jgi:hypothetical protein
MSATVASTRGYNRAISLAVTFLVPGNVSSMAELLQLTALKVVSTAMAQWSVRPSVSKKTGQMAAAAAHRSRRRQSIAH